MELHFVAMTNVFVYYPYLKKARSAPAYYLHGSVASPVNGIFIVQLNCPRTSMLLPLKALSATVGRRSSGLRPNSCPRLCERGLDQLRAERPPRVRDRPGSSAPAPPSRRHPTHAGATPNPRQIPRPPPAPRDKERDLTSLKFESEHTPDSECRRTNSCIAAPRFSRATCD